MHVTRKIHLSKTVRLGKERIFRCSTHVRNKNQGRMRMHTCIACFRGKNIPRDIVPRLVQSNFENNRILARRYILSIRMLLRGKRSQNYTNDKRRMRLMRKMSPLDTNDTLSVRACFGRGQVSNFGTHSVQSTASIFQMCIQRMCVHQVQLNKIRNCSLNSFLLLPQKIVRDCKASNYGSHLHQNTYHVGK